MARPYIEDFVGALGAKSRYLPKRDRIRNEVIREQLQVEPLQERIERTTAGGTVRGAY
jgi:hypothetical protein